MKGGHWILPGGQVGIHGIRLGKKLKFLTSVFVTNMHTGHSVHIDVRQI